MQRFLLSENELSCLNGDNNKTECNSLSRFSTGSGWNESL